MKETIREKEDLDFAKYFYGLQTLRQPTLHERQLYLCEELDNISELIMYAKLKLENDNFITQNNISRNSEKHESQKTLEDAKLKLEVILNRINNLYLEREIK